MTPLLTCFLCEKPFPRNSPSGPIPKHCSQKCKALAVRRSAGLFVAINLTCKECDQSFCSGRKSTFCGGECKSKYFNREMAAMQASPARRICWRPQAGDLIKSGGEYRWIVGVDLRGDNFGTVAYRRLPDNAVIEVTVMVWQHWAKMANSHPDTIIQHVLTRVDKPVWMQNMPDVATDLLVRQHERERGDRYAAGV